MHLQLYTKLNNAYFTHVQIFHPAGKHFFIPPHLTIQHIRYVMTLVNLLKPSTLMRAVLDMTRQMANKVTSPVFILQIVSESIITDNQHSVFEGLHISSLQCCSVIYTIVQVWGK